MCIDDQVPDISDLDIQELEFHYSQLSNYQKYT